MLEVFWGRIVLVDFGASLLLIGVWIVFLHPPEQRPTRGLAWAAAALTLGTGVALLFLLLRARRLASAREVFLGAAPTSS